MDLKDWEKVSEDDKSVTMRHPRGHTMTIATKSLPRIMQEQLKRLKLAKGGSVDHDGQSEQGRTVRRANRMKGRGDDSAKEMHEAKEEAKGRAEFERKAIKPKLKGLAKGGDVQYYEDGSSDGPVHDESGSSDQPPQPGPPANITINNTPPVQAQPAAAPVVAAPPPVAARPQNPAVQMARSGMPKAEVPQAPEFQPNVGPTGAVNPTAILANDQAIAKGQGDIDAATAKAKLPIEQQGLEAEAALAQRPDNMYANITQQTQDYDNFIKDHPPNPKHYQESMGAGAKTASAIGLFLGGLGTPFGGHNFAFDFLNKQIDRDIEAQRQRSEQQKTLLGAYQHLYGEGVAANAATRISMNNIMTRKMENIALQMGTPQAMINAQKAKAQFALQNEKLAKEGAVDPRNLPGNIAPGKGGQGGSGGAGSGGGRGGAGGKGAQGKDGKNHPLQGSILNKNADYFIKNLQYHPEYSEQQKSDLLKQYNQAKMADAALPSVNDTFMKLSTDVDNSGVSGRIHRAISPHAIAGLGGGVGAGIGAMAGGIGALPGGAVGATAGEALGHLGKQLTDNDINRRIDAQKTELKGYISAALKGTNIGSADIDEIVENNTPVYGDEAKTKATKLKTIRDFIIKHADKGMLSNAKLTND